MERLSDEEKAMIEEYWENGQWPGGFYRP